VRLFRFGEHGASGEGLTGPWPPVAVAGASVGQAIRDGVIEASLDHTHAFMQSKETVDVYATKEPQAAFHERIEFCLNLHNEAVKVRRRAIPRECRQCERRR